MVLPVTLSILMPRVAYNEMDGSLSLVPIFTTPHQDISLPSSHRTDLCLALLLISFRYSSHTHRPNHTSFSWLFSPVIVVHGALPPLNAVFPLRFWTTLPMLVTLGHLLSFHTAALLTSTVNFLQRPQLSSTSFASMRSIAAGTSRRLLHLRPAQLQHLLWTLHSSVCFSR
jgi:hypothetical protein